MVVGPGSRTMRSVTRARVAVRAIVRAVRVPTTRSFAPARTSRRVPAAMLRALTAGIRSEIPRSDRPGYALKTTAGAGRPAARADAA